MHRFCAPSASSLFVEFSQNIIPCLNLKWCKRGGWLVQLVGWQLSVTGIKRMRTYLIVRIHDLFDLSNLYYYQCTILKILLLLFRQSIYPND